MRELTRIGVGSQSDAHTSRTLPNRLFATIEPTRHPELRADFNETVLFEGKTQYMVPGDLRNIRNG